MVVDTVKGLNKNEIYSDIQAMKDEVSKKITETNNKQSEIEDKIISIG